MGLFKNLLARFVTKQALDQLGTRIRAWLIVAIDAGLAYLGTLIYQWVNTPADDVIMSARDAFTASQSAAGFATITAILSFVIRVVLPLLGTLFSNPTPPAAVLLFALFIPSVALSAPISGPDVVGVARFTAADLPKTSIPVWVVTPEPERGGYQTNKDGEFEVWGPPGTTHKVILIEIARDGSQIRTEHVFTFGGNVPSPTPGPINPDIPDGDHGLTKWAYAIVAKYPMVDRVKGHDVAAAFRSASSQLSQNQPIKLTINGTVKTYDANPAGLQKASIEYLAASGGQWPSLSPQIGDKVRSITDVKRQTSFYVTSWNAIAEGIDRAANAK